MNGLVNMKEFVTPIQYYMAEPVTADLSTSSEQQITLMVKAASAEMIDNIFTYWVQNSMETFTIDTVR